MDLKRRKERLQSDLHPLTVDLGDGDTLSIVYRRSELTTGDVRRFNDLIRQARDAESSGDNARTAELTLQTQSMKLQRLVDSVVQWDLVDNGEAIPLTMDGLEQSEVPIEVLDAIMEAIKADKSPNDTGRKSGPSS